MEFPEILRVLRIQHHLSQTKLAQKSGLSQTAISQFEAGTLKPSHSARQKLAQVLGEDILDYNQLFIKRSVYDELSEAILTLSQEQAESLLKKIHDKSL